MKTIAAILLMFHIYAFAQTPDAPNPDVLQETIAATICTPSYTATSYTNGIKRKLMREHGIDQARINEFEPDYIIPLALGRHPRNPKKLMLKR